MDKRVVQIDGLVLLKIIKHCQENVPEPVTGQLLGLDVQNKVEVTHAFPMPSDTEDGAEDYQEKMMKQLREVNVDSNTIGWYLSGVMGSWLTQNIVEAQYEYQREIPSSIMIVYDPIRTTKGKLSLKAYRLTKSFMRLFEKNDLSQASFSKYHVDSTEIFEELSLKVQNSFLVNMFLYELREMKSMSCDHDRLHLSNNQFLANNLTALSNCIDEYTGEQSKFQFHQRQVQRQKQQLQAYQQRREQENAARLAAGQEALPDEDLSKNALFKPLPEPPRLDTYLAERHMGSYCDQVTRTANEAFYKLFTVQGLMRPKN